MSSAFTSLKISWIACRPWWRITMGLRTCPPLSSCHIESSTYASGNLILEWMHREVFLIIPTLRGYSPGKMRVHYWHTGRGSRLPTTDIEAHKLSGPIFFLPQIPTPKACACKQHSCHKAPHPPSQFDTPRPSAAWPHGHMRDSSELNSSPQARPRTAVNSGSTQTFWMGHSYESSAGNGSSPAPNQPGRARVDGWLQLLFPSLGSLLAMMCTEKKKLLLLYQQMEFINILIKKFA